MMELQNLILTNVQMDNKLVPLQFSILEKIKSNNFVLVFDEVGCGKTIEAGIVAWDTIKKGGKNVLIVAPSNLAFNWYNEMLSKFGLDFKIIGGTSDSIDLYYKKSTYYSYYNDDYNVKNISNFCIVSYDSRKTDNSNAALDRLKQYDIEWNLVILDEGHESKNDASNRYKTLENFKSEKVVFLSATPIKNIKEDFEKELDLVLKILRNNNIETKFTLEDFLADKVIDFDLNYPISRNFKEILMEMDDFKLRKIEDIDYSIREDITKKILLEYNGMELDSKRGCIFLYDRIFYKNQELVEVYANYKKSKLDDSNYKILTEFDSKVNNLITKIDEIFTKDIENRIVIFCNHRQVVDYLKKILTFKYTSESVEAIHGDSYAKEERKNRIFLLDKNDSEMNLKKIVILSHNIGSVGINLSKFSHIINYELPYSPADLEQRFGRIDRITNKNESLTMYFFADENKIFDEKYLQRIVSKMILEVLPLLPSKNILFLSKRTLELYKEIVSSLVYIDDIVNKVILENCEKPNFKDLMCIEEKLFSFLEISISEKNNEIRIYDNKQLKELTILQLKEQLEATIKNIFLNIGISNKERMEEEIDRFVNSTDNKIMYIDKEQQIKLNFNQLKNQVYNKVYMKFRDDIERIDLEIKELSEKLNSLYEKDDCEKKGLIEVINFITEQISSQNINENMIFAVLYSIWNILRKKDSKLSFEKFIEVFNDGSCE